MSGRLGATMGHLFGPEHRTEPGERYRADPPKPPNKTGSGGSGGGKPPKKTGLCVLMLFGLFIADRPKPRPKPHGAPKKGGGKYPGDPRGNRPSSERRWDHQTGYRHSQDVGRGSGGGGGGNKAPRTGFCMLMALLSVYSVAMSDRPKPTTGVGALPPGAIWGSLGAAWRMGITTPKRFVLRAIRHYQDNVSAGLNLCPRTDGPHCSKYGYGAVSRYGAVIGMVLALRYMASCAAPTAGQWGDGECCKGESPTPTLPKDGCGSKKSSIGLFLLLTAAACEDYGPTGTCCRG